MAKSSETFHEGERAVQRAAGEQEAARQNAPMIVDAVMGGARPFLQTQRMLVFASRDVEGRPWASIIFGKAGFVSANDDGRRVTLDRSMAYVNDTDIFWSNLTIGAQLGMLAIELSTRRRLRVNGRVELLTDDRLVLGVEEAFPNCPKYIQRRQLRTMMPRERTALDAVNQDRAPDAELLAAVREADTIFVASGHPSRGLDASHRGGRPGFIQVISPDVLRIPDYSGNSMFNTLGNLLVDARCGLTLIDFQRGRIYQMTGEAKVHLQQPAEIDDSANTGRFWDFKIHVLRSSELPVQADWEFLEYSPYNPPIH